jgi:alkylation response protein AidB-like acyl-CoA dehydrogenase
MRFHFTEEQEAFRAGLRRFLEQRSPTTEVRRLMETEAGWEREGWRAINQAMGLTAVHIPEARGGQGFGFGELGIVLEEAGRALLCAPLLATAIAGCAILNAGTEAEKATLLPGIASGETVATLAVAEDSGRWDAEGTALAAAEAEDGWRLDGHKSFVPDGHTADLIVVLARTPQGVAFFTAPGEAPGLSRRALKTMDATRKLARLTFDAVPATPLGPPGAAAEAAFARTMQEAAVLLANEMVGGAERLREDSLAYSKMRMQFGRPIASFQTMKHKCADMLVEVELAKSAAYYAAAALDEGDEDLPSVASLAKAAAAEAYLRTAIQAIQIHGGIGFTWENDTQLWFKRAKSSEVLFGDAQEHRERMMRHYEAA